MGLHLRLLHSWLNAGRPGLAGCGERWSGMTSSSSKLSDSLSDSEIGGLLGGTWFDVTSFAGNRVSLNFTSQEILKCWLAASQNWYPLEPSS